MRSLPAGSKVGSVKNARHARAIEKVRMTLCRRQDAGRLAVGLAEMSIGGAGDQTTNSIRGLHFLQQSCEGVGRQSEDLT